MSTPDARDMSKGPYLIVKRDLYYMPNDCGYTGIKEKAGRYSLEEVAFRFPNLDSQNQDGTSFIHEDDAPEFSKACWEDVKINHIKAQRDRLSAENKRLREALEKTSGALNCLQGHMAVKFEGRHSHYGTMTIGQILDEADAALEGEDHDQA